MSRLIRRRDDQRGQALVEFALIIGIFVLVVVGIFEGGRAIYTYNAMSNAVREALREAIVHQDDAAIEAEANRVLGGLADDVTFVHDKASCTPMKELCMYRVELSYQFTPVLLGPIFSPTIAADGEMPVETVNP
jgi:hypothetical protein